jgi:hypothetical protein
MFFVQKKKQEAKVSKEVKFLDPTSYISYDGSCFFSKSY